MRPTCPVTKPPSGAWSARPSLARRACSASPTPARRALRRPPIMMRGEHGGVDLVAHGVGHREVQQAPLQREVEGVAADVAGGFQPPRERELAGLARVRARQQAVLDLGGQRQGNRALAPFEQVGEPAVGDDDVRQRVRRERDLGRAPARPAPRRGAARGRRWPPRGWSPARTRGSRPRRARARPSARRARARAGCPISGTRSAVSSPCARVAALLPAWPSRMSAWPLKSAMRNETSRASSSLASRSPRTSAAENGGASSTAASSVERSSRTRGRSCITEAYDDPTPCGGRTLRAVTTRSTPSAAVMALLMPPPRRGRRR